MDSKITIPIAIIVSAIVTAGIMYSINFDQPIENLENPQTTEIIYVEKHNSEFLEGTNDIKKISSQEELKNIIEASSMMRGIYDDRMFSMNMRMDEVVMFEMDESDVDSSGPALLQASTKTSSDDLSYSTTNVQIKNVDEPDFLKNDSKYVYIVSKNTLSIINAYPAESAKIILKIALDIESQYIQNMFLNEDRLVIFYNSQSDNEIIPQYDFIPRPSYSPITHALIVDISDKENPNILKDYSIDGHFRDARMIEDYVYFVTNKNIDYQFPRFPIIAERSVPIMTPDAFYFDSMEQFSNFNTLTAIDIFGDTINSETFLMGYGGTFYVSEDNFYLTYQQDLPYEFYENSAQDRFFDVIVPILPSNVKGEIELIQNDSDIRPSLKWMKISEVMQKSYNKMDKDERENLFEKIREALTEYDIKIQEKSRKTIIHKISINQDKIEYVAKGSVPGRLLNQFSMDQKDDRFRIATTTEYYTQHSGLTRANAVFILDEQLDIVGKLDQIAPDESIFSARFIDDRLYLVTFEQIDPFFVIDLSTDKPKILGELKIPGFSNYLHPFDEDHIIGIGRDTIVEDGRVEQVGIKIALFNVENVNNPMVADEVIIGDRYTNSESLHNHKAFFFDKTRNILSMPIDSEVNSLKEISNSKIVNPEYNRWSGFYVFDLNENDGFNLKGIVTHSERDSRYYGSENSRTFYIEDVLYTTSKNYIKMNSFDDMEEINSIKLGNTGKFVSYLEENITR